MNAILFLLFSHFDTSAEYRAYELTISDAVTNQSRVVLTTLDHIQYPIYYTIHKNERVQITSTWMCRDRTDGFAPICAPPEKPASALENQAADVTSRPQQPSISSPGRN